MKSGKFIPDFSGGLNTMFKYKNFSLYALFAVQWGGHKRLPDLYPSGGVVAGSGLPRPEQNVSRKLIVGNLRESRPFTPLYRVLPKMKSYISLKQKHPQSRKRIDMSCIISLIFVWPTRTLYVVVHFLSVMISRGNR